MAQMNPGKKIEHFIKNLMTKILRGALEQEPRKPQAPYKRILFFRFDVLGDMILSLPVYRATRDASPGAKIDVLCSRKNVILLQDTTLVDGLLIADKNPVTWIKLILQMRRSKYDLIINLVTHPSFTFGLIARLGGPEAVRIAGDQEKFSYFYNRNIDLPPKADIHMINRKFLVCQDFISQELSDIKTPWVDYSIEIKRQAKQLFENALHSLDIKLGGKKLAAINLTAGMDRREWPVHNYVDFFKVQNNKYQYEIDGWIVLTDPGKPEKTKYVIDQLNPVNENKREQRIIALPAQSDFRVIMEFLSYMKVLLTPDTSMAHAASAMGTPLLVMTIGENKTIWDPIGVKSRIVFSEDLFSLENLPVDQVIDEFDRLMSEISAANI
jgi:ADP-heptose:LPS heptosyltransferase